MAKKYISLALVLLFAVGLADGKEVITENSQNQRLFNLLFPKRK